MSSAGFRAREGKMDQQHKAKSPLDRALAVGVVIALILGAAVWYFGK